MHYNQNGCKPIIIWFKNVAGLALKALLLAAFTTTLPDGFAKDSAAHDSSETVRKFIAAFNAHDAGAMAELVTDDVQWLSVKGDAISVELEGKTALSAAMSDYFSSCPTCRSKIHSLISSGERVSVVEVASWTGRDGPTSQRALSVYEFSGRKIRTVYYFPEEHGSEPDESGE